jgi:hypothetical protein
LRPIAPTSPDPDQRTHAGMDWVAAVSGRDCSDRQITPPGPTGRPSRPDPAKCRISPLAEMPEEGGLADLSGARRQHNRELLADLDDERFECPGTYLPYLC